MSTENKLTCSLEYFFRYDIKKILGILAHTCSYKSVRVHIDSLPYVVNMDFFPGNA